MTHGSEREGPVLQQRRELELLPSDATIALAPQVLSYILELAAASDPATLHRAPLVSSAWAAATRAGPILCVRQLQSIQHIGPAATIISLNSWLRHPGRGQALRTLSIRLHPSGPSQCPSLLLGSTPLPCLTRLELGGRGWQLGRSSMDTLVHAMPRLACLRVEGCELRSPGALGRLSALQHLTELVITRNPLGVEGGRALAHLTNLLSLGVSLRRIDGYGIGDAGARAVAAALTRLTHLNVAFNGLSDAGICRLPQLGDSLVSLNISGSCCMRVRSAATMAAGLTNLTSLVANSCHMGTGWAAGALAALTRLRRLEVGSNRMGDVDMCALAEALTQLTELDISSNCVSGQGIVGLAGLTGLVRLDISHTAPGSICLHALAPALTGLTSLALGWCRLGVQGAVAVAQMQHLRSLSAPGNGLGDAGFTALTEALTQLTQLDVGHNDAAAAGCAALGRLVRLRTLDMSGNNPGCDSLDAIAAALTDLVELRAGSCRLGPFHAAALAGLTQLTCLTVNLNAIGADGLHALAQGPRKLCCLELDCNGVGPEACEALRALTSLTHLRASGNGLGRDDAVRLEHALPYASIFT